MQLQLRKWSGYTIMWSNYARVLLRTDCDECGLQVANVSSDSNFNFLVIGFSQFKRKEFEIIVHSRSSFVFLAP